MGEEKDKSYYDNGYNSQEEYKKPYKESRYYVLWTQALQFVKRVPLPKILEIGCGPGQFAHYLYDEGYKDYLGFDFSSKAIEIAKKRCQQNFICADAKKDFPLNNYFKDYNLVISLETLEHIKEDLDVIKNIREEIPVIFSVPSFDDPAHVRWFSSQRQVRKRYYQLIDIHEIITIGPYFVVFGTMKKVNLPLLNRIVKTRSRVNLKFILKKLKSYRK